MKLIAHCPADRLQHSIRDMLPVETGHSAASLTTVDPGVGELAALATLSKKVRVLDLNQSRAIEPSGSGAISGNGTSSGRTRTRSDAWRAAVGETGSAP
jgi:hypothetical protein